MKQPPIILLGAGGHAKVLLEILHLQHRNVAGVTTPELERRGSIFCGVPVLGGDEVLNDFTPDQIELVNAVGFVKQPSHRLRAFECGKAGGFVFANLVHPAATVSSDSELSEGVQIMAGVVLQPGVSVGSDSIINTGATVDHDCHLGAHVHVAPGATLCGGVVVGDSTLIGAGATVLQGLRIGRNCVVAGGALLRADLPDGATVAGVPARSLTTD